MSNPFKILLKPNEDEGQSVSIGLIDSSGRYKIGAAERPDIKHDDGFLSIFSLQTPTPADRIAFSKWLMTLEASEALCNTQTGHLIAPCSHEDLSDANAAYRHFLFGNGQDRTIDYERFISGDPTGQRLINDLINDFKSHVSVIARDREKFSVTSKPYSIGMNGFVGYPETTNWQKALGGHVVWVSADIQVGVNSKEELQYNAELVIHMEDRYNFNPGQQDIATGIPDSENGRFEITGLAKQYTNYGRITRRVTWTDSEGNKSSTSGAPNTRSRKPSDNRRLRNRL